MPTAPRHSSPYDQPVTELTINGCHITLLGTAHVSQASKDAVAALLAERQFDNVAVELCPSRYHALLVPDNFAQTDLLSMLKAGKGSTLVANLFLGAYQQRLGEELGIEPGAELRTAVETARAKHLPVTLIDREIGVTLRRTVGRLGTWRKLTLVASFLSMFFSRQSVSKEEIEKLKSRDMISALVDEFSQYEIDLFTPLIDERDSYMAARLKVAARNAPNTRWLVVIGAGHLPGIERRLRDTTTDSEQEIARLDTVPPPSRWPKVIAWGIVAAILFGFAYGFYRSPAVGWELVAIWFVINGTLAALGALAARAHPATIATAFVAAPFTSLNPMISAGVVAAAVEIYQNRPTAGDFLSLRKATMELRGWWSNRVARTLLVFVFATLGSALGTYIAGFLMLERLVAG